ncbi:unnamed protein product, partial [Trichogramma brassicae]
SRLLQCECKVIKFAWPNSNTRRSNGPQHYENACTSIIKCWHISSDLHCAKSVFGHWCAVKCLISTLACGKMPHFGHWCAKKFQSKSSLILINGIRQALLYFNVIRKLPNTSSTRLHHLMKRRNYFKTMNMSYVTFLDT